MYLRYGVNTRLVERAQRCAAKTINELRQLYYEARLEVLKLLSLQYGRNRGDIIEYYKVTRYLHK